jgi:hypothetical protein
LRWIEVELSNDGEEEIDENFGNLLLGLADAATTTFGSRSRFMDHRGFTKDPVDLL